MDQDETWHRGRPRARTHCVRWEPSSLPPCLLWSNGWLDQDATWYGGRPRPRRHYVRCGPICPRQKKGGGRSPHFLVHVLWPNVSMDQDATGIGSKRNRNGPSIAPLSTTLSGLQVTDALMVLSNATLRTSVYQMSRFQLRQKMAWSAVHRLITGAESRPVCDV